MKLNTEQFEALMDYIDARIDERTEEPMDDYCGGLSSTDYRIALEEKLLEEE